MRRRDFLAASCVAGLAPLSRLAQAADAGKPDKKQLLDLRLYRLRSAAQRDRMVKFLGEAAIPAWNRAGVAPVGVFQMTKEKDFDLYVLLPHNTAASVATCTATMLADAKYLQAGKGCLNLPKADPLYNRIESSLLLAFDAAPKVEVPSKKDTRVLQLRIYEAHNVERGQKKIEMFNAGGEVALFRKYGMNPVFFGEALVGTRIPNLTYMVGFDDVAAQKAAWAAFGGSDGWKKLSGDPQYKNTVSRITNIVLKPAPCSQV